MKNISISLLALLYLTATEAPAQRRTPRPRTPAAAIRTICQDAKVPAGFVVVAKAESSACTAGAWTIKRPVEREVVCDSSPVPDGYVVEKMTGSIECRGNPMNNALAIARAGGTTQAGSSACDDAKIGMSADELRACLGEPQDIRSTLSADGKVEVWTYTVYGKVVLARFTFQNDRLTTINYRK
ncbi:MAG: hypothetical protein M3R15_04610 [Acidobacteriota bacterium]|nr:hypothetical protein [Acidobacteriota bacterium]